MNTSTFRLEDLGIALAEHRAYNECIQFDGDECGECEQFAADFDAAHAEADRIATYNARYADYVTRRARLYATNAACLTAKQTINEVDLMNAHDWAAGDEYNVAPPDGYVSHKAIRVDVTTGEPVCPRCWGEGKGDQFAHINDGKCFECGRDRPIPGLVTGWQDLD